MAVIRVRPGESIQAAVNAADPGDTIRVAAGIFNETVIIPAGRNRLRIIGSIIGSTILDGENKLDVGIHIQGSTHVTIEHLTVRRYGDGTGTDDFGIRIDTSDNILRKVKVEEINTTGITISAGANRNLIIETISSNNFSSGISITGNNNYLIRSKFINNRQDGVFTSNSSNNNLFLENVLIGNEQMGFFGNGSGHLFIHNTVKENRLIGFNNFEDTNELIFENKVEGHGGAGIVLGSNNIVWGNKVRNNGLAAQDGIDILGNENRIIENKVEDNNNAGIAAPSSTAPQTGNIIDRNRVVDNGLAGIFLSSNDTNNAVRRNLLNDNNPDIQADPPADVNNIFDENFCETSIPPELCEDD